MLTHKGDGSTQTMFFKEIGSLHLKRNNNLERAYHFHKADAVYVPQVS